jgi:hypothetical protein
MAEIDKHVIAYGFNLSVVSKIIRSDISNAIAIPHVNGILSDLKLNSTSVYSPRLSMCHVNPTARQCFPFQTKRIYI